MGEGEPYDHGEEIMQFLQDLSEERTALLRIRCRRAVADLGEEASEEEVEETCLHQLKLMYVDHVLQQLQERGMVEVSGINQRGELMYRATDSAP